MGSDTIREPCRAFLVAACLRGGRNTMTIEFRGMRPDVVKRTFTEEELQRQKKNAAVYTDDASEYANNVKIVG